MLFDAIEVLTPKIAEQVDIQLSSFGVADFLIPSRRALSGIIGQTGLDKNFFYRAILRKVEDVEGTLNFINQYGVDYIPTYENGIPMSQGDIDTCAAFLVPDLVRKEAQENRRILITNPKLEEYATEYAGEVGILLVYGNDGTITPALDTRHGFNCDDFRANLIGYTILNFV